MLFFALAVCLSLVCAQENQYDEALVLARLAYAPARFSDKNPRDAALAGLKDSMFETRRAMVRGKSLGLSAEDIARARDIHQLDQQLELVDATRDAVAYVRTDPSSKEKKLLISYRGTAQLRDLIPDFQLATNRKKIRRLDEAREFAKRAISKTSIPEQNVRFYGHSLGGFIAEGVGNDFPKAQTISVEPGAPVIFPGKNRRAKSFNSPSAGARPHIRLVRPDDPITAGRKNLEPNAKTVLEPNVSKHLSLKNHYISDYLPWLKRPSGRRLKVQAKWAVSRAKARLAQVRQKAVQVVQNARNRVASARKSINNQARRVWNRARISTNRARQAASQGLKKALSATRNSYQNFRRRV